ncbi:putative DNA-binding protein [Paenibacillus sp. Soil750]|uniref:putative DNA-binding protein n=1 Tax=Paenibacillus sp. Soil750 TaxID=1736398 RepID=UPI0006F5B481|nr:putative DNA-binding protein [Paenibacillus sp. Soil750]KRE56591.1 DNA-binding protein [Paenibacillus sp. Soil750]
MTVDPMLEKTNRINLLFDFYEALLTDKQRTFLELYFHDDYSLGEIAENFTISRQAVYEHIKRAELTLQEYESKLKLLHKHEQRMKLRQDLDVGLSDCDPELKRKVTELFDTIVGMD